MTVRVITDSSAGLPPELAEQLSITVIDLHLMESHGKDGLERSTSGLSALELAAAYGREFDTFVVLTDNETWAGRVHPHQAMQQYREKAGIDAVPALPPPMNIRK